MSRTIWQGTISFGLVEIQVGLYPAEHSHELGLKMLDRNDFSPIGYKRYNKTTQREIGWDDIVRGYEYTKGEYVVLSDEELRRANPAVTQMVRILYFVDAEEIEPIYYEKPYYLAPLSKKSRGYALLRDTLKRTNTLGIARIAVHTREYIAAVGERDHAIVLYLLRFADEIRSTEDLEGIREPVKLDAKEIEMAEKLLAVMKQKWQPEKLKDEYANDVKKLVEKKVKAGKIHVLPDSSEDEEPAPRQAKIIDLMPLLKKSIENTRRSEKQPRRRARA
jgi:DNA end-binding protein Ku